MPRRTAGKIVPRKSPSKDSNGGKLGQFTTEVWKTKAIWWWKGFTSVNWIIATGSAIAGFALGLLV